VFVCSDPEQSALQILTWYAMRWAVEPTFQEARRHLGFETQRQWSDRAIHRTTPLLLGLFSLVTLWATDQATQTDTLTVLGAAWYRKPDPTFADCLAVVRRMLWAEEAVSPILWQDDYPTWRARARTAEIPTEGTANFLVNRRMAKSQQMRWTRRGADLLLQVRCAVYNGALGSGFGQLFDPGPSPGLQWAETA
jgi:hypothetical protein